MPVLINYIQKMIKTWQKRGAPQTVESSRFDGDEATAPPDSPADRRSRTASRYNLLELHKVIDLAG
jgi:hypothetical protein